MSGQKRTILDDGPDEPDEPESLHLGDKNIQDAEHVDKVPDGGWGWVVVFATMLSLTSFGATYVGLMVQYLMFRDHYQVSDSAIAWIVGVYTASFGLCGTLVTSLIKRSSCRTVGVAGGLILSLGLIATGFSPWVQLVYLTNSVIAAIGFSMVYISGFLVIGEYFEKRKATAMGIGTLGIGIGGIAYPPFLQYLYMSYGYAGFYLVLGGLMLNTCVCTSLYRPLRPKLKNIPARPMALRPMLKTDDFHSSDLDLKIQKDKIQKKSENEEKLKLCLCRCTLFNDAAFIVFLVNILSTSFVITSTSFYFIPLMVARGHDRIAAAFILSIGAIADCIGRPLWGIFMDLKRIKKRRKYIYGASLITFSLSCFGTPFLYSYAALAMIAALRAFCICILRSQPLTIIMDLIGRTRSADAFGISQVVYAIGGLIAAVVSGGPSAGGHIVLSRGHLDIIMYIYANIASERAVKDAAGKYDYCFYMAGSFGFLGSIVYTVGLLVLDKKRNTNSGNLAQQA